MIIQFSNIERFAIVFILIRIMKADNIIAPQEQIFMNKIFEKFNIYKEDIPILSNLDLLQCELLIKDLDTSKKKYVLQLCDEMAKCDGNVDTRELAIINNLFG